MPQRDTNQAGPKENILSQNMQAMNDCSLLLAVGKNTTPNWGAEVGYFWGSKKPVIILSENIDDIPLMTKGMASCLFMVNFIEPIDQYIEKLQSKLNEFCHEHNDIK